MIPSGNVTFLFTDIEGSTKLSQEFPDSLHVALEKHNSILRNAVETNNGFVFKIVGDAYFCAFHNAADAVNAAIEIQTALANEEWEDAVIKIRIGIHSGNAEWNGNDYMGYITLARVARVMSAAYGEQILISDNAHLHCLEGSKTLRRNKNDPESLSLRSASGGFESKDISFRDLGERRLKDVIQPIRLFQVLSEGLREDFPPLKTLDARPNNIPVQLSSFIGREVEIRKVKELLKQTRLLTLTGSGGSGKTRLALQAGAEVIDDFANGVWITELASLSEPSFLPQALMKIFGLKEEPNKSPEEILCDYLCEKEILIILDNCEHLIEASAKIAERVLLCCPKLKIIATSREILKIPGEQRHRVIPLKVPDPNKEYSPEKLSQYEAVRLFVERALSVDPKFSVTIQNTPALANICYQLDGIPLAIELAAARVKILSVDEISKRLKSRLTLLTGGNRTALPRQQTLRALIDWSYELLNEKEKLLFERLSVFAGGFTIESASEICHLEDLDEFEILDLLSNLADKSLISEVPSDNDKKFKILESIRHYGQHKFSEKAEDKFIISKKHLEYFMHFAEENVPKMNGGEVKEWSYKLENEIDNFRESIRWAVINDPESALILVVSLGMFFEIRNYCSEGLEYLRLIFESGRSFRKIDEAKGLYCKAKFMNQLSIRNELDDIISRSHELFREVNYKKGIADSLLLMYNLTFLKGDFERSQLLIDECFEIYKQIGDKHSMAIALSQMGGIAYMKSDYLTAKNKFTESLNLVLELKFLRYYSRSYNNLGIVEHQNNNLDKALEYYEKSLSSDNKLGSMSITNTSRSLINIGMVYNNQKNYLKAKEYYERSLRIGEESGIKLIIAESSYNLAFAELRLKNFSQSKKIFIKSMILLNELGDRYRITENLINISNLLSNMTEYSLACKVLSASKSLYDIIGIPMNRNDKEKYETEFEKLRSELTDEEFDTEWKKGEKINFENVMELVGEVNS